MSKPSADQTPSPSPVSASAGIVRQVLANKGFVACVVLLLGFTVAFEVFAKIGGIQFNPLPVPLRKSLSLLDQSLLRRVLFSMGSDLRGDLYDGRVAPPVAEAFGRNGIKLNPEAQVEVKEPGRRWQVTSLTAGGRSERTYIIVNNETSGRLDVYTPYRLLRAEEIKAEILDQLGTEQYIQWTLLDQPRGDEVRPEDYIQLFVTYYTGSKEQVPHVPEECYMGGGGYHVKTETLLDIPVPGVGAEEIVQVKMLHLENASSMASGAKIVLYVFNTNGRFCADRTCVRTTLANPYVQHAYFSKLEVTFGTRDELPTKEAAIEAGKRFLSVVIPILVKDHWPDWDQVMKDERQARSAGRTDGK